MFVSSKHFDLSIDVAANVKECKPVAVFAFEFCVRDMARGLICIQVRHPHQ